jgi:methylglyoxal synthase
MNDSKCIALVAHDNCKKDMVEWVEWNWQSLIGHELVCTGTTGTLVENTLKQRLSDEKGLSIPMRLKRLKSGPFGGDQQLGAMIAEGKIDILIFFWDPMEPHPHEVDVKALLRISVLYNIPSACNRSTADFLISSPLLDKPYERNMPDYSAYFNRKIHI